MDVRIAPQYEQISYRTTKHKDFGGFPKTFEDGGTEWGDMEVARYGTYLGFVIGPEKDDKS